MDVSFPDAEHLAPCHNTWVKSEKWARLQNRVNILPMSGCPANSGGDDQVILAKAGLLVLGLD